MMPLDKARRLGTYNQLDRSRQYQDISEIELKRAVNEAWSKIRLLESEGTKKDTAIAELSHKLRRAQGLNIALTAIITVLAEKGLEFLFNAMVR
jgi:hypothetical protein